MHFKRKRPRIKGSKARVRNMSSWPAWWDRVFHIRPKRRSDAKLADDLLKERVDPDEAVEALASHKPHRYYW